MRWVGVLKQTEKEKINIIEKIDKAIRGINKEMIGLNIN